MNQFIRVTHEEIGAGGSIGRHGTGRDGTQDTTPSHENRTYRRRRFGFTYLSLSVYDGEGHLGNAAPPGSRHGIRRRTCRNKLSRRQATGSVLPQWTSIVSLHSRFTGFPAHSSVMRTHSSAGGGTRSGSLRNFAQPHVPSQTIKTYIRGWGQKQTTRKEEVFWVIKSSKERGRRFIREEVNDDIPYKWKRNKLCCYYN